MFFLIYKAFTAVYTIKEIPETQTIHGKLKFDRALSKSAYTAFQCDNSQAHIGFS